jgi:hypothetical protein
MQRLVQTIALGVALLALALAVWRDYSPELALKRTIVAYLGAYFLSGVMILATRLALQASRDPEPVPEPETKKTRSRRRLPRRKAVPDEPAETQDQENAQSTEQPEPVTAR